MSKKTFSKGSVDLTITLNEAVIEANKKKLLEYLWKTGEALHTDLVQSQTMPFDTGNLQNTSTTVVPPEQNNGMVGVHTVTDYARRLYYHPEYKFSKEENPNAGAYWLQTYIDGDKKDFVYDTFLKFCEQG